MSHTWHRKHTANSTQNIAVLLSEEKKALSIYSDCLLVWWSRGIVVSVVSKPWVRRSWMRTAGSSHGFVSAPGRPNQLWVHPASCSMGTGFIMRGRGVNRPGREVDNPLPSNVEVKNEWSCTSAPPHTSSWLVQRNLHFYVIYMALPY